MYTDLRDVMFKTPLISSIRQQVIIKPVHCKHCKYVVIIIHSCVHNLKQLFPSACCTCHGNKAQFLHGRTHARLLMQMREGKLFAIS